ncbi:diaminobutyrate acetyltransferase [Desulfocapsa sulfexigens DSM 10523]|uniref:L-2,4-diaminobutyric acid acetyltransferase n=1 Tax=Desulfocapsa sulfexigens (strain DSM 10523 / SB164P1) TaxID=1167006 RepID=M1NCX3_DESSD|nr:diaminobutyrate acetyltransferase [Desulfocapsa sulfexigens]AGF77599.1 diaminobutyrate acetyltransferase [Desulfocapsa sulfexigens DSM 10523]
MSKKENQYLHKQISFRSPTSYDATTMQLLAVDSKVLSVHDTYYYALMARHFEETCVIAECEGIPCGYVTAYIPPGQPDTLFIWQVGVARKFQGKGVGRSMLLSLLNAVRPDFLEATISPDNQASIGLFRSVAKFFAAEHTFSEKPFFTAEDLGAAEAVEHLMHIGPFTFINKN